MPDVADALFVPAPPTFPAVPPVPPTKPKTFERPPFPPAKATPEIDIAPPAAPPAPPNNVVVVEVDGAPFPPTPVIFETDPLLALKTPMPPFDGFAVPPAPPEPPEQIKELNVVFPPDIAVAPFP